MRTSIRRGGNLSMTVERLLLSKNGTLCAIVLVRCFAQRPSGQRLYAWEHRASLF